MKIRKGFVTNSSSSSFIVAIKKECLDVYKQFGIIDKWNEKDIIHSKEDLIKKVYDTAKNGTWIDEHWYECIEKIEKPLEEGYIIISFVEDRDCYFNDSNGLRRMIDNVITSTKGIIIDIDHDK